MSTPDILNITPQTLPQLITAVGALGTAAFGLVDASKVLWGGGVNNIGYKGILVAVQKLTPVPNNTPNALNALPQERILATLKANWFNGTDLASQKAIAKSLIKLYLSPDNAEEIAKQCNLDPAILKAIAVSIAHGIPLTQPSAATPDAVNQTDVYARFDFILTALLDEVYTEADHRYTNGTRAWAVAFSIALSLGAARIMALAPVNGAPAGPQLYLIAFVVGLLAAPLAPIAKNLSSALATAVNTLQAVKK
jgi:hypothetical protein